jgi:hypothetical protein
MTPITRRPPAARLLVVHLLATWLLLATGPQHRILDGLAAATGRRWRQLRTDRDRGLATVEVAILAAVLLGLATALLAAIAAVVNKHMSQIK